MLRIYGFILTLLYVLLEQGPFELFIKVIAFQRLIIHMHSVSLLGQYIFVVLNSFFIVKAQTLQTKIRCQRNFSVLK